MKKMIVYIFAMVFPSVLMAQEHYHQQFSISDNTTFPEANEADAEEDLVYLKSHKVKEVVLEDGKPYEFFMMHQVSRLQTDAGIEAMNKIHINLTDEGELIKAEARVILPSGKVISLKKKDIREEEDYEGRGRLVFFALEGIEINSIVEFFYIEKEPARSVEYGRRVLQSNVPYYDVNFTLVVPDHLLYEFKSYGGLPDVELDTTFEGKHVYSLQMEHIPALHSEKFAYHVAHRQRLEYRLAQNTASRKKGFVSFATASKNVYNNLYTGHSKKGLKMVSKELKPLKLNKMESEEDKIIAIERYVKTEYNINEGSGGKFRTLEDIISAKITNEGGIVRLYLAMLAEAGITCETVLTSNRTRVLFDPDFETHSYLQTFLIYFPDTKKFMYPEGVDYRYGYFPGKYANNYGLFIKKVEVAGLETGAGKVRWIEPIPYTKNNDNHDLKIRFDEDFEHADIDVVRTMSGLNIMNIQTVFSYLNEESIDRITDIFVRYLGEDTEILEHTFKNTSQEDIPYKPFVIEAKLRMPNMIESAGDKRIFKIGETIGRQSELYQENQRVLPVEQDYNRNYDRRIEVTIPDGYRIANPDDLNMEAVCVKDDEKVALFHSRYSIEGNKLVVEIVEYYSEVTLPVEFFPAFQEVINAAADFNKLVLVLDKV